MLDGKIAAIAGRLIISNEIFAFMARRLTP